MTKKLQHLGFYYNYIIPKYCYGLLDSKQFREDLVNCIGLLDVLLENQYWLEHFNRVAEIVYLLPERYWTDKYKETAAEYVQKNELQFIFDFCNVQTVFLVPLFQTKQGYVLLLEKTKHGNRILQELEMNMQAQFGKEKCKQLYVGTLTIIKCLGNILETPNKKYSDIEVVKEEYPLIHISEDGGNAKLYFDLTQTKAWLGVSNAICIGDTLYKVRKKISRCILSPEIIHHCEVNDSPLTSIKKDKLMETYYYYSREYLLKFSKKFKDFSPGELCKLGIIGYFPDKAQMMIKPTARNVYYVREIRQNSTVLIGQKRGNRNIVVPYYDDLQVGDVCIRRKKMYYKIHDSHRLDIYGYHKGTIISEGKWKIFIKDVADGKKYVSQNLTHSWRKGDSVIFWPTEVFNPYYNSCWSYDVAPLEE